MKFEISVAIMRFAPGTAVCVISDVRWDTPAGRYAVESRVERVERLERVERVWVQVEHVAKERRSASLIRQDDDILGFDLHPSSFEFNSCESRCGFLHAKSSLK